MAEQWYAFDGDAPYLDRAIGPTTRKRIDGYASGLIKEIRQVRLEMLTEPCIQEYLRKEGSLHYKAMENLPEQVGEIPDAGIDSIQCQNALAEYSALQDLEDKLIKLSDNIWYEAVQNERALIRAGGQERIGTGHFMPWEFMIESELMR